jgi:hypothetical protein
MDRQAAWAFAMFRFAAVLCFVVAMINSLPFNDRRNEAVQRSQPFLGARLARGTPESAPMFQATHDH